MSADTYFLYFQKGQEWLRAGRQEDARIAFLKAARLLYERAKDASDAVSQHEWLIRAQRMQSLALQLKGADSTARSNHPSASSGSSPNSAKSSVQDSNSGSSGGSDENENSRWELTEKPDLTFADIAGLDSVKDLITQRVIFPLHHPEIASAYKRQAGAGIMMYGPPGTGKTMMAKAVAGELNIPFFSIQSSSILSKWVGEAEQNFRDLFQEARKKAPSVLFFDEAEALLSRRGGDSSVMDRVIPEFLAQVDGVSKGSEGLLLIGATNRPWDLDPAAVRTGRFGEKIYIPLPDVKAREFLIRKKLEEMPGAENIDFALLADRTEGFSGADINGFIYRIIDPVFVRAVDSGKQVPILLSDVETALAHSSPSVTPKELAVFEKYRDENG